MGFEAHPVPLRLTRESSTNDNVVILRVAIKNKVLIWGVLERNNHTGVLQGEKGEGRTAGSGGGEEAGLLSRKNGNGARECVLHASAPSGGDSLSHLSICLSAHPGL